MAKFKVGRALNMLWRGLEIEAAAGETVRISDDMVGNFNEDFVTGKDGTTMPGLEWLVPDEIASAVSGTHPDLATHEGMGLADAATLGGHVGAGDPHVQYALDADLANHSTDGHPGLYAILSHTHSAGAHTHVETDVTNLTTDLSGKAASVHAHTEGDVSNLTTDLASKAATIHTHAESSVTNLVSDLAGKAASIHTHAESSVTGLVTDLAGKAAAIHSHDHSALTNVTSDQHHIRQHAATSTADHTFPGGTTNFLRSDGAWAAPSGGPSGPVEVYAVDDFYITGRTGDPATLLGYGTWLHVAEGMVLIGQKPADPTYGTVGAVAGSWTHGHAFTQPGAHANHTLGAVGATGSTAVKIGTSGNSAAAQSHTHAAPSIDAHSAHSGGAVTDGAISPPAFVAHIWQRTA